MKIKNMKKPTDNNEKYYNQETKNFNSFDIAKFVCSILVVIIHTAPFGEHETTNVFSYVGFFVQQGLCRLAVPLFFIFSGFFLYRKTPLNKFSYEPTKKYIIHILKLYLLWSLIYLPLQLLDILHNTKGILYGIGSYIKKFIFVGSYSHLWYLNALLCSVSIVSFLLHKKFSPKKILCISLILYVLGLFGDTYYGLITSLFDVPFIGNLLSLYFQIFDTTRNGLFFAFFFLSLGMFLSENKLLLNKRKSLLFGMGSVFMLLIETFILNKFNLPKDYNIYLFAIPVCLFCFLYFKTIKLKDNNIYIYMRKISSLIFYGHMWIFQLVIIISNFLVINISNTPLLFFIVLGITIFIAIIIIKLSEKRCFRWLKHFY